MSMQSAIVTNKKLIQYGIRKDAKCTFCNLHIETLLVLFYDCSYTAMVYTEVTTVIEQLVPQAQIQMPSVSEVIFNEIHPNANGIEYLLFLVAKYHIFWKRCAGVIPNIREYKNEIELIRDIGKYNAVKNNKLDKHIKNGSLSCKNQYWKLKM